MTALLLFRRRRAATINMVERKLFILESYYSFDRRVQMWRVTNPEGISWYEDIDQYSFVPLSYCRAGVVTEVSKIQSKLQASGNKW